MSEINENEQEIDDSGEIQMLLRILSFLAANKKLRNFIDKENPPPIVPNIGVGVLSYTICEMLLVSLFTWLTEILGKGLLLMTVSMILSAYPYMPCVLLLEFVKRLISLYAMRTFA